MRFYSIFVLWQGVFGMDLTQILTMSAMQSGESVDPMQIMLMTQLLKDDSEDDTSGIIRLMGKIIYLLQKKVYF